MSYMAANQLYPTLQSAYRQHHSTGKALLKVKNDILISMNNHHVTLLVLLDLSAAFDTVDHAILLECLRDKLGVSGTLPWWFSSYFTNRTQTFLTGDVYSDKFDVNFSVPQGSCLGPLLFRIYTSEQFKTSKTISLIVTVMLTTPNCILLSSLDLIVIKLPL